jgi:hypothetical protein
MINDSNTTTDIYTSGRPPVASYLPTVSTKKHIGVFPGWIFHAFCHTHPTTHYSIGCLTAAILFCLFVLSHRRYHIGFFSFFRFRIALDVPRFGYRFFTQRFRVPPHVVGALCYTLSTAYPIYLVPFSTSSKCILTVLFSFVCYAMAWREVTWGTCTHSVSCV